MSMAVPYHWTIRTKIGCSPWLFNRLFGLFNEDRSRLVSPETELVIEGFPRSGNSYAVNAFAWAQGREVRIANHIHAPCQALMGLRLGKPVCLLIRDPRDAIPAFVAKMPHLSARDIARGYLIYYRALVPLKDQIVVATFDQVTADFGAVISRINEKFDKTFKTIDLDTHRDFSQRFLAHDKFQSATQGPEHLRHAGYKKSDSEQKRELKQVNLDACDSLYRQFL